MKITIDFNLASLSSPKGVHKTLKHFIIEKDVHDFDSLHNHAISIVKESGSKEYIEYIQHIDNKNQIIPIFIFPKTKDISNIYDIWKNKEHEDFGIKYRINSDETIRLLNGYQPLYTDITFLELKQMIDNGYVHGDYRYLIIDIAQGLGGGTGTELISIFETISSLLTLYEVSTKVNSMIKKIIHYRKSKKWRKIARVWNKNNGFSYSNELRIFFDSKGNWKTKEIQKRLKISEQTVNELMFLLGYELVDNEWLLGQSEKANTRRNKWLSKETRLRVNK